MTNTLGSLEAPTVALPTRDQAVIRVKWRESVEPYRPTKFMLRSWGTNGIWFEVGLDGRFTLGGNPDVGFPTTDVESFVTLAHGLEEEEQ